jgi:hypothetical protein
MATKKELLELKKLLEDINRQYTSLNKTSPFKGQDAAQFVKTFENGGDAIASATISLKAMRAEVAGVETGLDDLKETFRNISKELGNLPNPLKDMEKGFNKIKGLVEKINDVQQDLSKSSAAEIRNIQRKGNLEFQRLKRNIELLDIQHEQLHAERKKLVQEGQSTKQVDIKLGKASELLAFAEDEAQLHEEKVGHQKEFNKTADATLKRVKNIKAATGLTGSIIKSLGGAAEKIGFGDMSETLSGVTDKMADQAAALTNNGKHAASLGDQFKIMGTGLAGLGTALMDQLTDPLVILTMIVKSVKFLVGIFSHVLKITNKIGQSVGLAGKNAENLKKQIHAAGDLSGDMFYNTEEMAGAYSKLNKAAGTNLKFNAENAKTFQDLTLYMGVSEEAAAQLFKMSAQTGKSYTGMYDQVRDVTQSLNESSGYSISTQDAIEAIAQSSGTVRFNIQGGTEGLVKAAHTAARLGLTMADIAAAAETHLDFESSIAKEIEAEMYLQKDLNLDKLRHAALTGNTAMAAEEEARLIKENYKSLKGNVLAQKAFSAATGISMDKLGGAMVKQEELAGLSGQALKDKLAEGDAMEEMGKNAVAFDRTLQDAVLQMKALLEPLANVVGPIIMGMAKSIGPILKVIGSFASSGIGKLVLGIAGIAVGYKVVGSVINKMKDFFGLGKGKLGSSPMNPMHVTGMGGGGGGGGDMMRNAMGGAMKGNIFKYLGKKGGLSRTLNRSIIRMFGKTGFTKLLSTRVLGPLSKTAKTISSTGNIFTRTLFKSGDALNNTIAKVVPNSGANLQKSFGTNNMSKIAETAETGRYAKGTKINNKPVGGQFAPKSSTEKAAKLTKSSKGGNIFSRAFKSVKGVASKSFNAVKGVASKGVNFAGDMATKGGKLLGKANPMEYVKKAFKSPLAKGLGKVLGPIMAAIEGFSNVSSSISNAKAQQMAGEKVNMGSLGKEIVQGAAYPIANLATNLIPGVGTAISLTDGVLSAFGLSPIKWLTDNLIDLIPDSAFTGLGKFAIGDSKESSLSSLPAPKMMAVGGIVTSATNAVVGEAGPEAVIPLKEFYNKIDQLIAAVNKRGDVYLDAQKVGYTLALQSSKM